MEGPDLNRSYAEYCRQSAALSAQGSFDEAITIAGNGLVLHPDNIPLMEILANALAKAQRHYEAALVLEKLVSLSSHAKGSLAMLAKAYVDIGIHKPSYWDKAIEVADRSIEADGEDSSALVSKAYIELQRGNWEKAFEFSQTAFRINKNSDAAVFNMSIAMLANHMWEEGWYSYNKYLHPRFQGGVPEYPLPLWNGDAGEVIVTTEQGLGDAIMFASIIPDLQKEHRIIVDTIPKMAGLLGRNFGCEVHGTKTESTAAWKHNTSASFWVPIGSLGYFYRNHADDFPGTPYLTSDPERKIQWTALLDSLSDKPKIGIAWSGGVAATNEKGRSLSLRDLAPILEYDAEWISLQYKNTDCPDYIHHWPRAVESEDYEDTAALIDSLDLIISVTTTAVHCAGALGKEVWTLVPEGATWRYGTAGKQMPWYDSVELLRQKDGIWPIQEICDRLSAMNIEKCRNLSTKTRVTVLPQKAMHHSSPWLSDSAKLERFLIMDLAKAA